MRSVRARATVGAVVVVGLVLVLGSTVFLVVLRQSYVESVQNPARSRAGDVVVALEGDVPAGRLQLEEGGDRFTQVVDGERVVTASANALEVGSLAPLVGVGVSAPVGDADDEWVIVTAPVDNGLTVVVGRELDPPLESVAAAAIALVVGVPLVLVVVGVTTWRVVQAALTPVEAIRAEVSAMGPGDLATRVATPGTGDEIDDLATTMNEMLDRLDSAHRRQRQFVSDASHELRSPLAAIRQNAEVAMSHPDRTRIEDLAEVVLIEEARLEHLVAGLLLLTRSDEGGLGLRLQSVDLDDLALAEARRARDLGVEVDTTAISASQVVGDEALLQRALRNLVDNAVRHAGGRIRIVVGTEEGEVVLAVHDDGPGIPESQREAVLQRFVRLDGARSADAGGAGLGLAIVAEVATAHGGEVSISDSPLGGAAVTIRLPARGVTFAEPQPDVGDQDDRSRQPPFTSS